MLCFVDIRTSVFSCRPLKKKIAHTATYFTVTSGRSGPGCNRIGDEGGGVGWEMGEGWVGWELGEGR